MFERVNLVAGVCAVLLFVYAQAQGWNLLENESDGNSSRGGSSRTYHK